MNISAWVWIVTIVALLGLITLDLFVVDRDPHEIRTTEAVKWVVFYVLLAVGFGLAIGAAFGSRFAGEFFAGYITEYSLSVDNLFVFVLIISTFAVPAIHQYRVLLFGILAALAMRGLFIAAGAAVIARFHWIFYVFGAFLVVTAWRLAFGKGEEEEYRENRALRLLRRVVPVTHEYHGPKVVVRVDGRRHVTPMLVVMLAIGSTDLLFALDSIPAIFGLTRQPFLIFTANAFALMGLRQLFFLLGGLLNRLVYLSYGLAAILGLIGVKLIFEALDASGLHGVPHVGIAVSLIIIASILAVTTVASLIRSRSRPGVDVVPGKTGGGHRKR